MEEIVAPWLRISNLRQFLMFPWLQCPVDYHMLRTKIFISFHLNLNTLFVFILIENEELLTYLSFQAIHIPGILHHNL